jgi:hypothetical protein
MELRPKDKRLEDEVQQLVKGEKKKKRIQDKEEELRTNLNGIAPPLSRIRSSCTSRNFQGCLPEVETPDLTMHRMMKCCSRMSGWPRFDGMFKNYPAFKREWGMYQQLIPQEGLCDHFKRIE